MRNLAFEFENQEFNRKVDSAIERIKTLCQGPGYIAYSGGKDSEVIRALARMAGCAWPLVYHVTTVDPPELVRHIRSQKAIMDHPGKNYCRLIETRGLPTRWRRWCCAELKHGTKRRGDVMLGVRWQESAPRRARWSIVQKRPHGFAVCPIVDWTTDDVWRFVEEESLPVCSLYAEGHRRLGCIGCPLARGSRIRDFARWPQFARAIERAYRVYAEKSPSRRANQDQFWFDWCNDIHGEPEDIGCEAQFEMFGD